VAILKPFRVRFPGTPGNPIGLSDPLGLCDEGKEPSSDPDATGAGDKADRAASAANAQALAEKQQADARAEGAQSDANKAQRNINTSENDYYRAIGQPIPGGANPPPTNSPDNTYGGDNPPPANIPDNTYGGDNPPKPQPHNESAARGAGTSANSVPYN
jgi:hypothetical protein